VYKRQIYAKGKAVNLETYEHSLVIDANTGAPIGYGRATIRLLMTFINTWACYIGWIWVAFDPRKQGWHDKVANSVVVHYP